MLVAGDLEALFLPRAGMLCASLRHRGDEMLGRVENIEAAAAKGSTAGIPLLHPWANRIAGLAYRAAGRSITLDRSSPLLHFDDRGLPMHGVPWPLLAWETVAASQDRIAAQLDWTRSDLLEVFPFRHRIQIVASLERESLTLETKLTAGPDGPVPVSFGFHPYFVLPGLPRAKWQLDLPAMRRLALDERGIPSGAETSFPAGESLLGKTDYDSGFALLEDAATFTLTGGGRRVALDLLGGYRYAQVFAPRDKDYVALEPMTAPTGALTTPDRLRLVEAGQTFPATFKVRIETTRF
jgi:aldose 1-epimerase